MGSATGLLMAQLAEGGAGLGGSIAEANAYGAQGRYERQQGELLAQDALRRGDLEANAVRTEASRLEGAQKAAAAAGGVDPSTGSAAMLQEETKLLGERDAMVVRNNAWREAFGHRDRARMAGIAARQNANQTIATGGMAFGRSIMKGAYLYDKYKTPSKPTREAAGGYAADAASAVFDKIPRF